jgi:N-acyl-phosphatidylethanolamine-hydrolysing phospholipase D
MRFTWIGGPSFVLEIGPFRVVGDPVLCDTFHLNEVKVSRLVPAVPFDATATDAVLITSSQADHFDPEAIARCGAGTVLLPAGAPAIVGATEIAAGASVRLEKGTAALSITAVPAAGGGNGYFLRLESGPRPFTAYITGDSIFSEDTRAIQRTHGYANLLVIHAGAERAPDGSLCSADAKEAMQIVYRMQPNAIAAVHHNTFSHYTEALAPLVEKIGLTIYEKRLRVLREGESFEKVIGPGE